MQLPREILDRLRGVHRGHWYSRESSHKLSPQRPPSTMASLAGSRGCKVSAARSDKKERCTQNAGPYTLRSPPLLSPLLRRLRVGSIPSSSAVLTVKAESARAGYPIHDFPAAEIICSADCSNATEVTGAISSFRIFACWSQRAQRCERSVPRRAESGRPALFDAWFFPHRTILNFTVARKSTFRCSSGEDSPQRCGHSASRVCNNDVATFMRR